MEVDLQIKKYIERALEEQSFRICEITLTGSSEISDGYASNITFATVLAATNENITKTIEVVVKSSKKDFVQTNRNVYERETYFYKTILPEFTRFQKQNNDTDRKIPSKVAIIDWQASRLHSPVLDLSFFIYSTCSEEQLRHFDELLDTYHTSFSMFLRELGCDPEKLFPYSALVRHWQKYSLQAFLLVTSFLHIPICEKEEAPELETLDGFCENIMNMKITNEVEYRKRLIAIISHYYNYTWT
ncbi:uncharacterized protein LOC108904799 [Anoplophora glabripennis]|uniref:uncharacterized protein LOC108904799 n=1 Tax=Anoplophora glabripennis TaxID=217634 RepID=UPI000A1341B1|nr:uncharacterized protein LOC108904799 [Anoplophora glabripennis]